MEQIEPTLAPSQIACMSVSITPDGHTAAYRVRDVHVKDVAIMTDNVKRPFISDNQIRSFFPLPGFAIPAFVAAGMPFEEAEPLYWSIFCGEKTDKVHQVIFCRDYTMHNSRLAGSAMHDYFEAYAGGWVPKHPPREELWMISTCSCAQFIAAFPDDPPAEVARIYGTMHAQKPLPPKTSGKYAKEMQRLTSIRYTNMRKQFTEFFEKYCDGLKISNLRGEEQADHEGILDTVTKVLSDPKVMDGMKSAANIVGFFDAPLRREARCVVSANVNQAVDGRSHAVQFSDLALAKNPYGDKQDPLQLLERAKKTWCRIGIFNWSTTSAARAPLTWTVAVGGNVYYAIPVTPMVCGTVASGAPPTDFTLMYTTNLSFLSQHYDLWNGSLDFKFEAICTGFHQGQIMIVYVPGNYYEMGLTGISPIKKTITLADMRNCMTYCLTLNEADTMDKRNVVEFNIPYMSHTLYRPTGPRCDGLIRGADAAMDASAAGYIYVIVQNTLVAANTVSGTISINAYVKAGADFDMQVIDTVGCIIADPLVPGPSDVYTANVNGVYQMNDGETGTDNPGAIFDNARVAAPEKVTSVAEVAEATTTTHAAAHSLTATDWETVSCMPTATTENIWDRDYLIGGFNWTTSQVVTTVIYTAELPKLFFNTALAANAIRQYHLFAHMDFDFTIKINPTQFHCGILRVMWVPSDYDISHYSFSSTANLAHVDLNVATGTMATLHIPYSSIYQFLFSNTGKTGSIVVAVWNPLNAAAVQSQTLNVVAWIRAKNPWLGVKTAPSWVATLLGNEEAEEQIGDSTSKPKNKAVFLKPPCPVVGPIQARHSDTRQLLHRPEMVWSGSWETATEFSSLELKATMFLSMVAGHRHRALLRTVAFVSGNTRYHFVSTENMMSNKIFWTQQITNSEGPDTGSIAIIDNEDGQWWQGQMRGTNVIKACQTPEFVVEIEGYRRTPYVDLSQTRAPTYLVFGVYGPDSAAGGTGVTMPANGLIEWSIGDNFQGHLCMPMPYTRHSGDSYKTWDIPPNTAAVSATRASLVTEQLHRVVPKSPIDNARHIRRALERDYREQRELDYLTLSQYERLDIADLRGEEQCDDGLDFSHPCAALSGTGHEQAWYNIYTNLKDLYDTFMESLRSATATSSYVKKELEWAGQKIRNIGTAIEDFAHKAWSILEWACQVTVLAHLALKGEKTVLACQIVNFTSWLLNKFPGIVAPTFSEEQEREDVEDAMPNLEPSDQDGEKINHFDEWIMPMLIRGIATYFTGSFADMMLYIDMYRRLYPSVNRYVATLKCVVGFLLRGPVVMQEEVAIVVIEVQKVIDDLRSVGDIKCFQDFTKHADLIKRAKEKLLHFNQVSHLLRNCNPIVVKNVAEALEKIKSIESDNKHYFGKMEPIATYICGKPGAGKTSIVTLLSLATAHITGCNPTPYIWPSDVEQKYADGYKNEDIVTMDDALMSTDPTQLTNAIRLFNCEDVPVNMADIKDKGKRFTSRFIILTSNVKTTNANEQEVNTPDAFVRRMTFKLEIEPRPDYRDAAGRMDRKKFSELTAPLSHNFSLQILKAMLDKAYTVRKFHFGANTVEMYSWNQYFEDFGYEYERRTNVFNADKKMKIAIMEQIAKRRPLIGPLVEEQESVVIQLMPQQVQKEDLYLLNVREVGASVPLEEAAYVVNFNQDADYKQTMALNEAVYNACEVMGGPRHSANQIYLDHPGIFSSEFILLKKKKKEPRIKFRGLAVTLVGFITAAGLGALAVFIYKSLGKLLQMSTEVLNGVFQGDYSRVRPKARKPQRDAKAYTGFTQGPDNFDYIRKNVREIKFSYVDDSGVLIEPCMHCTCISDRFFLIPLHFMERREKYNGSKLYMSIPGKQSYSPITVLKEYVFRIPETQSTVDIVLVECVGITHARNIMSSFASQKLIKGYVFSQKDQPMVLLDGMDCDCGEVEANVAGFSNTYLPGKSHQMLVGTVRSANTKRGDCGRPYVGNDSLQNKILGIHCAGAKGSVGMSVVTFEMLDGIMSDYLRFGPNRVIQLNNDVEVNFQAGEKTTFWDTDMENLGRQEFNGVRLEKHPVPKTKFERLTYKGKTFAHKNWECEMLPAAQTPKVIEVDGQRCQVHPLYTGVQKYVTDPPSSLNVSVHDELLRYYLNTRISRLVINDKLLDEHEMINGFERDGLTMEKIVINTSSGYWTLLGFKDGKKDFFDVLIRDGDKSVLSFSQKAYTYVVPMWGMTFCERLHEVEEMCRRGDVPFIPWVTGTKDELRPIEKVKQCKTRTFEMPGLEHTLLMRKYFGHFIAAYKAGAGVYLHHGIGKDKPTVWAEYFDHLTAVSERGFDIDYKNYDGSVTVDAYRWFLDVVDFYYSGCPEEDRVARHALIKIMQEAYLIVGTDLCCTYQGNKSGSAITDIFNSITNTYVIYAAYGLACHVNNMPFDMSAFDNHIRFITYGDDVIVTRAEGYMFFDRNSVADMAKMLGMTVTPANKTGVLTADDDFSDLTFLCSSFVCEDDVVLCPMKKQNIYKELYWRPKDLRDDTTDFKQRIQITCAFMAEHGEDDYNKFKQELRECGVPETYIHCGMSEEMPSVPMRFYSQFKRNKFLKQVHGNFQMDDGTDNLYDGSSPDYSEVREDGAHYISPDELQALARELSEEFVYSDPEIIAHEIPEEITSYAMVNQLAAIAVSVWRSRVLPHNESFAHAVSYWASTWQTEDQFELPYQIRERLQEVQNARMRANWDPPVARYSRTSGYTLSPAERAGMEVVNRRVALQDNGITFQRIDYACGLIVYWYSRRNSNSWYVCCQIRGQRLFLYLDGGVIFNNTVNELSEEATDEVGEVLGSYYPGYSWWEILCGMQMQSPFVVLYRHTAAEVEFLQEMAWRAQDSEAWNPEHIGFISWMLTHPYTITQFQSRNSPGPMIMRTHIDINMWNSMGRTGPNRFHNQAMLEVLHSTPHGWEINLQYPHNQMEIQEYIRPLQEVHSIIARAFGQVVYTPGESVPVVPVEQADFEPRVLEVLGHDGTRQRVTTRAPNVEPLPPWLEPVEPPAPQPRVVPEDQVRQWLIAHAYLVNCLLIFVFIICHFYFHEYE
jgi:hypothetical protein